MGMGMAMGMAMGTEMGMPHSRRGSLSQRCRRYVVAAGLNCAFGGGRCNGVGEIWVSEVAVRQAAVTVGFSSGAFSGVLVVIE